MIEKLKTYLDELATLIVSLFDPDPRWTEEEKIMKQGDAVLALIVMNAIALVMMVVLYTVFVD